MRKNAFHASAPVSGYTLLELMIVLAILGAMMAIAWPRISRRMQLLGPREAALQLKADLAQAREQAIITGTPWLMRVRPGKSNYEFGTLAGMAQSSAPLTSGSANFDQDSRAPLANALGNAKRSSELPLGLIFARSLPPQQTNANEMDAAAMLSVDQADEIAPSDFQVGSNASEEGSPNLAAETPWNYVAVFQPDGRSTNTEIVIVDEVTLDKMRLQLRGFTGSVSIGDLERAAAAANAGLLSQSATDFAAQPGRSTRRNTTTEFKTFPQGNTSISRDEPRR